jgi:hypothetical protein
LAGLSRALPAKFPAHIQRVDASDFDLEKLLNCLANLGFVGPWVGHDRVLVVFLALTRAFFSQPNGSDNFERFHGDW